MLTFCPVWAMLATVFSVPSKFSFPTTHWFQWVVFIFRMPLKEGEFFDKIKLITYGLWVLRTASKGHLPYQGEA